MTDIHRRVSRRLTGFLSNSKSADRVAAEIIQMVAASGMPLSENNADCSRPKAGSPTAESGDAQ